MEFLPGEFFFERDLQSVFSKFASPEVARPILLKLCRPLSTIVSKSDPVTRLTLQAESKKIFEEEQDVNLRITKPTETVRAKVDSGANFNVGSGPSTRK